MATTTPLTNNTVFTKSGNICIVSNRKLSFVQLRQKSNQKTKLYNARLALYIPFYVRQVGGANYVPKQWRVVANFC